MRIPTEHGRPPSSGTSTPDGVFRASANPTGNTVQGGNPGQGPLPAALLRGPGLPNGADGISPAHQRNAVLPRATTNAAEGGMNPSAHIDSMAAQCLRQANAARSSLRASNLSGMTGDQQEAIAIGQRMVGLPSTSAPRQLPVAPASLPRDFAGMQGLQTQSNEQANKMLARLEQLASPTMASTLNADPQRVFQETQQALTDLRLTDAHMWQSMKSLPMSVRCEHRQALGNMADEWCGRMEKIHAACQEAFDRPGYIDPRSTTAQLTKLSSLKSWLGMQVNLKTLELPAMAGRLLNTLGQSAKALLDRVL